MNPHKEKEGGMAINKKSQESSTNTQPAGGFSSGRAGLAKRPIIKGKKRRQQEGKRFPKKRTLLLAGANRGELYARKGTVLLNYEETWTLGII